MLLLPMHYLALSIILLAGYLYLVLCRLRSRTISDQPRADPAQLAAATNTATTTTAPSAMDKAGLTSTAFDLHSRTGFLPSQPPLERLPALYAPWEAALDSAKTSGGSPEWRQSVLRMPSIPTDCLKRDIRQARRAHLVLAFLAQFYVQAPSSPTSSTATASPPSHSSHSHHPQGPPPQVRIPASIAVPLVDISRHLGLAPILTYADTVLWNWRLIDPRRPIAPDNVAIQTTFTGSSMEEHFYLVSILTELKGAEALEAMAQVTVNMDGAKHSDKSPELVSDSATCLQRLSIVIGEITEILLSVREGCDPTSFYTELRPWLKGADHGPDSLPWIYEGVDENVGGLALRLAGPSGGQSTLMHAVDVFLGIEHTHTGLGTGCAYARGGGAFPLPVSFLGSPSRTPSPRTKPHSSSPLSGQEHASFRHRRMFGLLTPPSTPKLSPSSLHPEPSPSSSPSGSPLALSAPLPPACPMAAAAHASTSAGAPEPSFSDRMRGYMPRPHHDFLIHLASHSVRHHLTSSSSRSSSPASAAAARAYPTPPHSRSPSLDARPSPNAGLLTPYHACLDSLKRFRDAHIQVVTRYVISPRHAGSDGRKCPGMTMVVAQQQGGGDVLSCPVMSKAVNAQGLPVARGPGSSPAAAAGSAMRMTRSSAPVGTGGTSVLPLLKAYRDDTVWAREGLIRS